MKRTMTLAAAVALAGGAISAHAQQNLIHDGTIDNLSPGTAPDCAIPAGAWHLAEGFCEDTPLQFQVVPTAVFEPGAPGNTLAQQILPPPATLDHGIRLYSNFDPPVIGTPGSVLVVEFDIWVAQAGMAGGAVLLPSFLNNGSTIFNVVWFADGTIQTGRLPGESGPGCGNGFQRLVPSYTAARWQHVRLVVDLVNHNWDMWWSYRGETPVPYADHRSFLPSNQWSDVGAFAFAHLTPVAGSSCTEQATFSYLDNVSAFVAPDCIRNPGGCPCYANCDGSTSPPILNVADFSCFLNAFAAGDSYANCDHSTAPPVLNVADFSCFLNQFAAGCN
jgi:hypothetical protein